MSRIRGRYAPSPTGELHLGNASTALLAWLSIRAQDGTFVMRMEDLDQGRVRPGYAEAILDDLRWFGLDWDEGPDVGGDRGPYDQGSCGARYDAAFERLRAAGRLYPCFCSRKDIAAAASAPQTPGDEARYAGTCRELAASEVDALLAAGRRRAWRFRVDPDGVPGFEDRVHGQKAGGPALGDFVVRRSDGVHAYQLAVVVDDAAMGIGEVVRGDDLLGSTPRQLLLFRSLDLPEPRFGHVPLLMGTDGARLSKRHQGITLRELREAGRKAPALIGWLAARLGLRAEDTPVTAGELVDGFDLARLSEAPREIVVDL